MNQNMILALLPKVPLMLRVALLHMLRLSQQSKYLDLQTELIIAVIRSFTDPSTPQTITATQKMAAKAPKLKGKIWVSTYTCPPPPTGETGLQDAIAKAIDGLRNPKVPQPTYEMPDPAPIEGEWTGYRADATSDSRLPKVSQKELYAEMMKEVKSPVTILYFHGGAYYMLDPATHRPTTKKLAKLTGGRVYSVRYRLAPQHPFPAALMDALMSYLALLYPPEGAFHEPVRPEHIVFAGDR
jgi:acetyl esterase/lipase